MSEVVLFDNDLVEGLVVDYQTAETDELRDAAFQDIALSSIPLIRYVSLKSDWLTKVNETDVDAIVSEITLKLPKLLEKFNPGTGTRWFSYLTKSIENKFRHWNRGINVRKKYG